MEGKFLYLLPPGATISRFAKTMSGVTMEGEVIDRAKARIIYQYSIFLSPSHSI
jgi:hypothetical protein